MTPVTDPNLISTLNDKAGLNAGADNQSVTDPNLISILNKKAGIADQGSNNNQVQNHKMVNTMFGKLPDINDPANKQAMLKIPDASDYQKASGVLTMLMAPEIKFASLLPKMISSRLPQLTGGAKIAADYLTNIGKVGGAGYLGSKMMGEPNKQAGITGLVGGATAAAATPLTLMTSSMNPLVRLFAGGALGSLAGYGAGQLVGGGNPYTTAGGGVTGALLGLRGGGAAELAAQNAAQTLTPEQIALAKTRESAGQQVGVPLTLAESTGSPVIGAMQQNAAMSSGGSKVMYPFGMNRQAQEENSYQNVLNQISPNNASALEEKAFKTAFNNASQNGVTVDTKPVVDYINQELPKHESGSKIAQALNQAKARLRPTPMTEAKYSNSTIPEYENSVEGLHNAKMGINGIIESQGDNAVGNTAGGVLKQVNKKLNAQIKDASPEYAAATRISSLRKSRQDVEDAMAKSNISGSNFYDKVLANKNEYNALHKRLSDPENPAVLTPAQKSLQAMREAFPDLMDNLTAKSGKALAEKGAEINLNMKGLMTSFLNKIYMDRYNKAVAELMINPNWHDELMNVAKMKAGEDRGIRLGRLISKVAVAGGAAANQNNQQGRESYASQP